jgi:hypothetical protein
MPNLRITVPNYHDEAVLTTELESFTGFAVGNTQNVERDSVWRSGDLTAQKLYGVFPNDGHVCDSFGLFRHGCLGGTIQFVGFSTPDWTGTPEIDTGKLETVDAITLGSLAPFGTTPLGVLNDPFADEAPLVHYFTAKPLKSYYFRFEDTHVKAINPYWQVGRIVLGQAFEVGINPAYGAELGFSDTSAERTRTRGGTLRVGPGAMVRSMMLDFQWVNEADRPTWEDVMRYAMTSRDVMLSLFPNSGGRLERSNTINGTFSSLDGIGRQISWLTKKVVIEEN